MKKILMVFLVITTITLTACPPGPGNHTHEYGTAWKSNAAEHWHECTANDGAKTDIAAHTAGAWIIDTPATATADGSQHKECTVCGYETETETIPILPPHTHTYAATYTYDATQHWRECTANDGAKTDVGNHTGNPCTVCSYEEPEYREATITFDFTPNNSTTFCTAEVQGTLLLAEWNNVIAQLPTAINNAYATTQEGMYRMAFSAVFSFYDITIIVKKTLDNGNKYEVKQDQWDTLYLNYAYLVGNATDISEVLIEAIVYKMADETAGNDTTPTLTGTASISGNAVVGETLTVSFTGTNDITYGANTYQWTRAQGNAAPANINGATNQTYVIVAGDVGYTLSVNVGNTATVGTVSSGRTQTVQEARGDKGPQLVPGFFDNAQAMVRGVNLTAAEWQDVLTQLPQVINTNYGAATEGGVVQERYANVFSRPGFTITVENTGEYENWKTDATGLSLRLRIDKLATWGSIMNAAIRAVNDGTATQARVMPGRDTVRS